MQSWELDVGVNTNTLQGTEVPWKQALTVMLVSHLNFESIQFNTEICSSFLKVALQLSQNTMETVSASLKKKKLSKVAFGYRGPHMENQPDWKVPLHKNTWNNQEIPNPSVITVSCHHWKPLVDAKRRFEEPGRCTDVPPLCFPGSVNLWHVESPS